jgi:hypothetical protein
MEKWLNCVVLCRGEGLTHYQSSAVLEEQESKAQRPLLGFVIALLPLRYPCGADMQLSVEESVHIPKLSRESVS